MIENPPVQRLIPSSTTKISVFVKPENAIAKSGDIVLLGNQELLVVKTTQKVFLIGDVEYTCTLFEEGKHHLTSKDVPWEFV
jgi:hypothetical protein